MQTITLRLRLHQPTKAKQAVYRELAVRVTGLANDLVAARRPTKLTSKTATPYSVQVTPCVGTKVAGVDLGLRNLAVVNCEGETLFFSGDQAAFVRRRFNALRRRMGKAKALGAILRMENKEARWMKNQDHEISRKIVDWCIARGHAEHADSVGAANSAGAISGLAAA